MPNEQNKFIIVNTSENYSSPCLSLEELISYSNYDLPSQKQADILTHIQGCKFCSDALNGMAKLSDKQGAVKIVRSINKNLHARLALKTNRIFYWKKYGAMAAIFFIALVSVFYFIKQLSVNDVLFYEYYKPYPNIIPLTRSSQSQSDLEKAMRFYEMEKYKNALVILHKIISNEPENQTALFYSGICQLQTDDIVSAIVAFRDVTKHTTSDLYSPANWFLGLCYLKKKNVESAKQIFNQIVKEEEKYSSQSRKLLKKMNSIQ